MVSRTAFFNSSCNLTPEHAKILPRAGREVTQHFTLLSINLAFAIGVFIYPWCTHAQTFDGVWEGYYVCGRHSLRPELGPFAWQRVSFKITSGQISTRRDYITSVSQAVAIVQNAPAPSAQPPAVAHHGDLDAERQRLEAQTKAIEAERQKIDEAAKRAAAQQREATAQEQRAAADRKAAEEAQSQVTELMHQKAPVASMAEPSPGAANPPLAQLPTPASPPSPQKTTSSSSLPDTAAIGMLAFILVEGITVILLMVKRKRDSETRFFLLSDEKEEILRIVLLLETRPSPRASR